jgi:site-specific recombinase XerD
MQNPPKKLLDQVRDAIRLKHYSYRTEETYVQWIVRYILFHNKRHPKEMGVPEIEEFLTHLAVEGNFAAATQNQALNAILFLYRQVLQIELEDRINAIRAKRPQQIPIVLSPDEAFAIIQQTTGVHRLMLQLLYGSGLRLRECMELRSKISTSPSLKWSSAAAKVVRIELHCYRKASLNRCKFTFNKFARSISKI